MWATLTDAAVTLVLKILLPVKLKLNLKLKLCLFLPIRRFLCDSFFLFITLTSKNRGYGRYRNSSKFKQGNKILRIHLFVRSYHFGKSYVLFRVTLSPINKYNNVSKIRSLKCSP